MSAVRLAQLFVGSDDQQAGQEFLAETAALPLVADQDRDFGFVRAVNLHHAADAEDFALAGLRIAPLRHQRHFAIVIDEADAG